MPHPALMPLRFRKTAQGFVLGLAAAATLCNAGTASAAEMRGVPAAQEIDFTVLRNGDEIGTHVLKFSEAGDALDVRIATDISVQLPLVGITVYRFKHRGHEVWRDGKLAELDSETDDDGKAHKLSVTPTADSLHVESEAGTHDSAPAIVPASLWNPDLVGQSVLLNTLDGSEMPVAIEDLGRETVKAGGTDQAAEHFRLSGGLSRDLWYNDDGELVRVQFAAEDDSTIEYVLN